MAIFLTMSTKSPTRERNSAWSRRSLLYAGGCLPLLAACSSDPNSESSALWDLAGQTFRGITSTSSISRDQAGAIPYATIGVRIGDSDQFLLALESKMQGVLLWTSSARIALETQSSRIVHTAGLEHDVSQTLADGSDPLQHMASQGTCQYVIDMPDRSVFQASVRYELKTTGRVTTEILGTSYDLLHAVEHGSCPSLGWEFDNEYWLGGSFAWRSRQSLRPDLEPIEVTVLRPAA